MVVLVAPIIVVVRLIGLFYTCPLLLSNMAHGNRDLDIQLNAPQRWFCYAPICSGVAQRDATQRCMSPKTI